MHDIWNPWHGCKKISEGCLNCYMMHLDQKHDSGDGKIVYKTSAFNYPLAKKKDGTYKIKAGEMVRVCMTSDFFVEEADEWRDDAWKIIKKRSDVIFYLLTKRPERVKECLPKDFDSGYDHVFFNVTCENQKRADERIKILKTLPFKHKGIMLAPILGPIEISKYLKEGFIEQVACGGENYGGTRPCHYSWIESLSNQCKEANVTFAFIETGTHFIMNNKCYQINNKVVQSKQAYRSRLASKGKPIKFILRDEDGYIIPSNELYTPKYTSVNCLECGSRLICNGCSKCGKCKQI